MLGTSKYLSIINRNPLEKTAYKKENRVRVTRHFGGRKFFLRKLAPGQKTFFAYLSTTTITLKLPTIYKLKLTLSFTGTHNAEPAFISNDTFPCVIFNISPIDQSREFDEGRKLKKKQNSAIQ